MAFKKIIAIILATIFAVALCATAVSAYIPTPSTDGLDQYFSRFYPSGAPAVTSLPCTVDNIQTSGNGQISRFGLIIERTSNTEPFSFAFTFMIRFREGYAGAYSLSDSLQVLHSNSPQTGFSEISEGYSCSYETSEGGSFITFYITILDPTLFRTYVYFALVMTQTSSAWIRGSMQLFADCFSPYTPPEPIDPSLEEYSEIDYSMYYINEAPSGGSFTSLNHAFLNLPSPIYQSAVTGSPSQFWIGGFLQDWNSVLTDNVVLEGRFTLYVQRTDGSSFPDSMLSTISCIPYFAIGSEPSVGSSWLHVSPPSSWNTSYKLIVDDFLKGKLITFSYYIVTSSDIRSDIQFTPSAFGFILDGGTYIGGDFSYNLLGLYGKYAPRSTPDSPLPDNPNDSLLPGLSSYVPHSSNVYNSQVADELAYLDSILGDNRFKADEVYYNLIDQLLPSTEFDNFYNTLNTLYNSISYDDIDFEFILPRTSIPWFGNQESLTLWGDKPIPFKYYIDSLPSQYTAIFGFIVLFSGISVFIGSFLILLRKSFSWSVDTN